MGQPNKKRSRSETANFTDDDFNKKTRNKIKLPKYNDKQNNNQLIKINELKQEIADRHVNLDMIIALNCTLDAKIELMRKFYELENIKECAEYLEKYMALWTNYNNIKIYPPQLTGSTKQNDEICIYYEKLKESGLDDRSMAYLNNKIYLLASCKSEEESYKLREYLDFVTNFPWNTYNREIDIGKLKKDLPNIKIGIDNAVYGIDECKDELIRHYLNFMLGNTSDVLAICGPPGIGKTCILRALSESTGMPMQLIQGGCITDMNYLTGHSPTYINSQPGIIAECIKSSGRRDIIIMIDELDKIFDNNNQQAGSIINTLIHIFDKSQADKFHDSYIGNVPINIDKIMFCATMNNVDKLSDILKNRLKIIYLDGYNSKQKIDIARNYVVPKMTKSMLFRNKSKINIIKFSEDVLLYLINNVVEKEHGIRSLERCIKDIINVIQYKIVMEDGIKITDTMSIQLLKNKILPCCSYK